MSWVKMAETLYCDYYYIFRDYHIMLTSATARHCASPVYSAGLTHGSTPTYFRNHKPTYQPLVK